MFKKSDLILYIVYILIVSVASYFFIHKNNIENYKQEIRVELLRLDKLAARLIDGRPLEYLVDNLVNYPDNIQEIEASPEYKAVRDDLFFINDLYSDLSGWCYIYYPTDQENIVHLTVPIYEEITYGELYDISSFPVMIESLYERTALVEPDIGYDEEFDIYLISAFSPIYSEKGRYLGHFGIDIFLEDYNQQLRSIAFESIMLSISVVFVGGVFVPFAVMSFFRWLFGDEQKAKRKKKRLRRSIAKARRDNK